MAGLAWEIAKGVGGTTSAALKLGGKGLWGSGGKALRYGLVGAGVGGYLGAHYSDPGNKMSGAVKGALGGAAAGAGLGFLHAGAGLSRQAYKAARSRGASRYSSAAFSAGARAFGLAGKRDAMKAAMLARASWGSTRNAWSGAFGAFRATKAGRKAASVAAMINEKMFRRK